MILEESLFSFLSSDTAVGAFIDDRVFGQVRPQTAKLPAIVYTRVSPTQRSQTMCKTDSKVRASFHLECQDKTYLGSKQLAKAVRQTLTDFTGDMNGTRVSSVALDDEFDVVDPDPGVYGVSQIYFIWFTEE